MRYEKAEIVLRVALDMQGSAYGLTLHDIQHNYAEVPLSRRTAERLRDAVERLFPQMELANPGEVPKRWRLPAGKINGLASITAEEVADLKTAVSLLRRENMHAQALSAERMLAKLRALWFVSARDATTTTRTKKTGAEGPLFPPPHSRPFRCRFGCESFCGRSAAREGI